MSWNLLMLNMRQWTQPRWLSTISTRASLRPRLERIWPPLLANRNFFVAQHLLHHPAIERTLFLDQPPMDARRAVKTFLAAGFDRMVPWSVPNAWMYSSILPELSRRLWVHRIRKYLRTLKMERPLIVWSYHPLFPEILESFPSALAIFDAVDDWTTLPQYQHRKTELEQAYERIARRADIIFTVSESLKNGRFNNHPHCAWVPNGVDLEAFRSPKPWPLPDLDRCAKPVIGYVGVIQSRLDVELLEAVIAQHLDKTFVFVGTVWPDANIERLARFSNIKILGALPYDSIPAILSRFQVAIIPHRINALTATMNPLKIYEYLAAGLPVVTTPIAGIEPFRQHLEVASNAKEFADCISSALAADTPENRKQRQKFVEQHTWDRRIQTMLQTIELVAQEKGRSTPFTT